MYDYNCTTFYAILGRYRAKCLRDSCIAYASSPSASVGKRSNFIQLGLEDGAVIMLTILLLDILDSESECVLVQRKRSSIRFSYV